MFIKKSKDKLQELKVEKNRNRYKTINDAHFLDIKFAHNQYVRRQSYQ